MRRTLIRSAAIGTATAAALAGLGPAAPAAVAATAPVVVPVLNGGYGDGGPAAEALLNATAMRRDASGNLLFADTHGIRRIDASTGHVDAAPVPALSAARRADGIVTDFWLAGTAVVYAVQNDRHRWLVRVPATGPAVEVFRVPNTDFGGEHVLTVLPDGSFVLDREGVTVLANPAGTEFSLLVGGGAAAADVAADGTLFFARGSTIYRYISKGVLQEFAAAPTDGLEIQDLAVTPDGTRAVYSVGNYNETRTVRSFAKDGAAVTVAGSADGTAACPRPVGAVLAEANSVLVACGGIRSYAHSGEHAPRAGAMVAGLNDVPGIFDAPDGTPLSLAFLSHIFDFAVGYDGRITALTRYGVYELADGVLNKLLPAQRRRRQAGIRQPRLRARRVLPDAGLGADHLARRR